MRRGRAAARRGSAEPRAAGSARGRSASSSASSIGPGWAKSCGCHSLDLREGSRSGQLERKQQPLDPIRLDERRDRLATPNSAQSVRTETRRPAGDCRHRLERERPDQHRGRTMKPPCRFAHASSARPRERAARGPFARGENRAAPGGQRAGRARTCGRASRPPTPGRGQSAITAISGGPSVRAPPAARRRTSPPAAAAPVSSTTPLQPAIRWRARAGLPPAIHARSRARPEENGERIGARDRPMPEIHSPVATCDQVSPSPSTAGENAQSANRKTAIAARPSPASRASAASSLAERTNGKAKDIARACQRCDNATLNRSRWNDARHRRATRLPRSASRERLLGGRYRPQSAPDAKPPLWSADA